ncbi:MAG: reverse transcriptase, partial [Pseudomonadota bacterium]
MQDWHLSKSDLKRYPHFDKYLRPVEIEAIVKDPDRVRANPFFPFLRYNKSWQPFRSGNGPPKRKERPIRYASRRDAYIFGYYRHLLAGPYEQALNELEISDCVIAYRKIPVDAERDRGKCNIHFAKDVFDSVT